MSKIWDIPYKLGAHLFGPTSQLNDNFNVLYLRNKTWYRQSFKCVDSYNGSPTSFRKRHELWSTNGFQLDRLSYPPYVNSTFYFIARLRRRTSANRTQPHFAKRRTVNCANNLLYNSWGHPTSKKLGARKLLHLFCSLTTSILNGKYLQNEKRHRQLGKFAGKYEGCPTLSKNFINFGSQTA